MVSVDVKHHVYLLTVYILDGGFTCYLMYFAFFFLSFFCLRVDGAFNMSEPVLQVQHTAIQLSSASMSFSCRRVFVCFAAAAAGSKWLCFVVGGGGGVGGSYGAVRDRYS